MSYTQVLVQYYLFYTNESPPFISRLGRATLCKNGVFENFFLVLKQTAFCIQGRNLRGGGGMGGVAPPSGELLNGSVSIILLSYVL